MSVLGIVRPMSLCHGSTIMKALILFGVSLVLGLGMVLGNPEPLSGAQNASDCEVEDFITLAWKHPSAWRAPPGQRRHQRLPDHQQQAI